MKLKTKLAMTLCSAVGLALLVVGIVLIDMFNDDLHSEVNHAMQLKNGSDSYKRWRSSGSPTYFVAWIFDVVNYEEVMKGDKPVVVEKGPYTYSYKKRKVDITYNDNGTVSYRQKRLYTFQRNMSVGSENDTFHSVNIPMLTVASLVHWESQVLKDLIYTALNLTGERLFVELSVYDLLWGYEDKMISAVDKLARNSNLNFTVSPVFGLFQNQNGSDDGMYQIYSGLESVRNLGKITSWNGKLKLKFWTSDLANMINGSDGTIYPPFVDSSKTKYMVSSDLCRSIGLDYTKKVVNRGIDMNRFVVRDTILMNSSTNPYNAGFCTPKGNCLPSGLLNISTCKTGIPIIMSMPHFLGCASEITKAVVGMKPDRDKHQSYLDIETITGTTMNSGMHLQINVFIKRIEGFIDTCALRPVFLPVMWFNESSLISGKDAVAFQREIVDKMNMTRAIEIVLISCGSFIIGCVIAIIVKRIFCLTSTDLKTEDTADDALISPYGSISS